MAITRKNYVPGTWTRIPPTIRSYREKFKVVGRNVFVKLDAKATVNELLADKRTLEQIGKQYPNMTLGQIATKLLGGGMRKATPAEAADYRKRKERCDQFIAKTQTERKKRIAALHQADIKKAAKKLENFGFKVTLEPVGRNGKPIEAPPESDQAYGGSD